MMPGENFIEFVTFGQDSVYTMTFQVTEAVRKKYANNHGRDD